MLFDIWLEKEPLFVTIVITGSDKALVNHPSEVM